jgi:putative oxidoreductase
MLNKGKLPIIARYILGVLLLFFGLNGFLQFMAPPTMNDAANSFMGALTATGYMFTVINLVFLLAGISLLTNKYVPLSLLVLAPITVNIVLFHLFLHIQSGLFGVILAILHIYLASEKMNSYKGVLKA